MEREIRAFVPAEIRTDGGEIKVSGYAAVFGEETNIGGMFREVIAPGAFTDAIGRDDVVFLINHDGLPLARTRSGTLTLTQDATGLRMETVLDGEDPDVKSIVGKMKRGDLDKMSFAFLPDQGGQEWDDSGDIPLRTIRKASLFDVSIVTTPAYDGTSIGLRSLEAFRAGRMDGGGDAEPDINAAIAKLKAAVKLHQAHMDGKAPTTGPDGEKSQKKLMDMIVAALAAITGQPSSMGDSAKADQKSKNFNAAAMRHRMKMNLRLRRAENG